MSNEVSKELQEVLTPLLSVLPLESAMTALVVRQPVDDTLAAVVHRLLEEPAIQSCPGLQAGLWLYVDGLHESHAISQKMPGPTGAFWHGIMHRREGDFGNAKYWFRQAEGHPVFAKLPDYDPYRFVDAVQTAAGNDDALVAQQRTEWAALMEWCFENPDR